MTFHKPVDSAWAEAINLLEQADRLHRQFFRLSPSRSAGPTWEPPADVFETNHNISVLVALPGVAPDQVKVVIDGSALVILGQRPLPAPTAAHIRRIEIPYGRFERRIELPPGHFEIQESALADGCLRLNLLKHS